MKLSTTKSPQPGERLITSRPHFFDIVRTFIALIINNPAVTETGNARHSINNHRGCPFTVTLLQIHYRYYDYIQEKFRLLRLPP